MKRFFILMLIPLLFGLKGFAQFSKAEVSIIGLTCSQCSRSVEMMMKKLPFIKSVNMDLANTEAIVSFSKDKTIDFRKLAQSVRDAGFDLKQIKASYSLNTDETKPSFNFCFIEDKDLFYPVKDYKTQKTEIQILLLDKNMMSKKEFKKYRSQIGAAKNPCKEKASYSIPYLLID
ncbi:MAG TPA: heavy metal-associated domain-containing protein [Edaphocola sp.]|nr:heavy metal-associated domain-containing protein [Edaphocola sp.]